MVAIAPPLLSFMVGLHDESSHMSLRWTARAAALLLVWALLSRPFSWGDARIAGGCFAVAHLVHWIVIVVTSIYSGGAPLAERGLLELLRGTLLYGLVVVLLIGALDPKDRLLGSASAALRGIALYGLALSFTVSYAEKTRETLFYLPLLLLVVIALAWRAAWAVASVQRRKRTP